MAGNGIAQIRDELIRMRQPERKEPAPASRRWVALFFTALLLLGLWAGVGYGRPWDEGSEQDILIMNVNEYLKQFGSDTRYPLRTDPAAGGAVISESVERDHGMCAFYPVWFLATGDSLPEHTRMVLWHSYIWLWFMAAAAALYGIAREMKLSRILSCAAVLFLCLMPRLFAQGHYNNKDIILFALVSLMLLLAVRLADKPTVGRAVPFALAGAMATNTKIIGLLVFGLCALYALAALHRRKRLDRTALPAIAATVIGYAGFFILLTPASWSGIPDFVGYTLHNAVSFGRWGADTVLFQGRLYHPAQNDPLPFYYLPYMILVTTPLWLLALIAVGQIAALWTFVKHRRTLLQNNATSVLLLCTALWVPVMAYVTLGKPVIYNGWRHFYFLAAPLLALAAGGLKFLYSALQKIGKPWLTRLLTGVLAASMALTGVGMAVNHPYQYTYYNPLLSGRDISAYMELDYWNVSAYGTLQKLLNTVDGEFAIIGADYFSIMGLSDASLEASPAQRERMISYLAVPSDQTYVMTNPMYANISGWKAEDYQIELVLETEAYGRPICQIYKNK